MRTARAKTLLLAGPLLLALLGGCLGGGETATTATGGPAATGTVHQTQSATATKASFTNETGAVEGVVANDVGAKLSEAHVTILGTSLFGRTDARGFFAISDVPPGPHTLRVDAESYQSLELAITVESGRVLHLNITVVPTDTSGAGFRPHLHDHWGELTQITLVDDSFEHQHEYFPDGSALLPCMRIVGVLTVSSSYCYEVPIQLPETQIVPPGTEQIDVTVDWESAVVPEVYFVYQPTNETEPRTAGPIAPGDTLSLPVAYPMTDHGHQLFTLWQMELYAPAVVNGNPFSSQYFNEEFIGPFDVKIVAFKGEIPTEPAHATYWENGDTRAVIEAESHTVLGNLPKTRLPNDSACTESDICWRPPEGKIVPPGTTRLHVLLEYEPGTAAMASLMTQKTLSFRPANLNPNYATVGDFLIVEPTEIEFGRTVYSIPLDPIQTDAFYQAKSLWYFLLANEGKEDSEEFQEECLHFIAGCGGTTYTLAVTAVNETGADPEA